MKQRIIACLVALLSCVTGFANSIQADGVTLKPGETKDVVLSLTSGESNMAGVQFDVVLPTGFSLAATEGAVYQLASSQPADLSCNVSNLSNGAYRFVLYSNGLLKLKEGELMRLHLKADSNTALGNYKLTVNNVAFSDADGQVTKEDGTTATIKLTNFYPSATNIVMLDTRIISGKTAPLTLQLLETIRGCTGIQFDLQLPDGFSVEADADGKEYTIAGSQAKDIACNVTEQDGGCYRFIVYSNTLQEFVPGELMNINLKVSEEKPYDTYTVSIKNVLLSDAGGNVHKDEGANANVTVTRPFTPGDVNDDGVIDEKDVDCVVSYMLDNAPSTFVFEAADMNGDNRISAVDLGYIINLTKAK